MELDLNYIDPRYYYAFELFRVNELNKAVDVLKNALIVAKKNKNESGIAGINLVCGAIYKSWGRYEKAIEYYEEALKIRVEEKNLQDEAKVLTLYALDSERQRLETEIENLEGLAESRWFQIAFQ